MDETSPLPGRWRSNASPWVRAVMEDFANNTVRDIAVQSAAAQSSACELSAYGRTIANPGRKPDGRDDVAAWRTYHRPCAFAS